MGDRQDDIRAAIEAGSQTVANSIESLPSPPGWRLGDVSASFGDRAGCGGTFDLIFADAQGGKWEGLGTAPGSASAPEPR